MDVNKIPARSEIPEAYTWDLRDIFESDEAWRAEYEALMAMPETIAAFAGTLAQRPGRLLDFLKLDDELTVRLTKLSGYANCKGDQDLTDGGYQDMRSRANACVVAVAGASAFATPEIMAIGPPPGRWRTARTPSARPCATRTCALTTPWMQTAAATPSPPAPSAR